MGALQERLRSCDLHVLNGNLWFDGGKGVATGYHNDLWWSTPLRNSVLQVWIPLVCEGDADEIANSMVRLDPTPVENGWACAPGTLEYTQVWTGETRPLSFTHSRGRLTEDLEGALGGKDLQVGDVLYFDNAYAHYTLPARAQRVGLALRLTHGIPVYNGYFSAPRPLDGQAASDHVRRQFENLLRDYQEGQEVPPEVFLERLARLPRARWFRIATWLMFFDGRSTLHPILQQYVTCIGKEMDERFGS